MRGLRTGGRFSSERGGFAMIAVLLVLLALFVLATPYLLGIRRADRESERVFDRMSARLALDDAARHARARLDATHPAVDTSPYWDSMDELAIDNHLDPEFVNANDPNGVMWDLDATDLSGRVDLGSASPGVLANLMGGHTWLAKAASEEDASLKTASTRGFAGEGFLWVGGERMAYLESDGSTFGKLERELFGDANTDAVNPDCDFARPRAHDAGAPVLGLEAFALPLWRIRAETAKWRTPADFEQVREAFDESISGPADELAFMLLKGGATTFGGLGAGPRWQRATRLVDSVVGGNDCALRVEEAHYFNPGTTVQISNGAISEMAIVREVIGSVVKLERVLLGDYDAFDAVVRPLARRPVNLNSAPPEVLHALFLGLKLRRRNARITDREANQLVDSVLVSRPFTGFEDFLNRVVLPAAGLEQGGAGENSFMDAVDAEALYRNGLNANDRALEFSTMPFAFTTRGTFGLSLRSSINAKSGIERASLEREQVEVMVPQRELMRLWTRQEDFDEELRLSREAPLWSTGPSATSLASNGANPPSRFAAHFGTLTEGALMGELAPGFASRDEHGWAQLFATRTDDRETDYHSRHVEHMDRETSNLEGMDFSRAGAYAANASDPDVEWTGAQGDLLRPFSFAMWVKPQLRASGALYFDLGDSAYPDTDRVSLSEEGTDLLVSVLDAGGDHRLSVLEERTEVRVPIEHFPLNTWTHLSIDVRGSRPDQITVLVDGMARGETSGLTKLATNLGETATTIQVDSTEGFGAVGERCVVQIGNEIIEAEVMGPTTLLATPYVDGMNAGIGGRAAREQELWRSDGSEQLNQGIGVVRNHPALSAVQLFGYSRALRSSAPVGATSLPTPLGPFAVAEVHTVEGGTLHEGDLIEVEGLNGARRLGTGIKGRSSNATGLVLRRGDDPGSGDTSFLSAFNTSGGYAMLVQREMIITFDNSPTQRETIHGEPLGGMELIRYTGIKDNILQLALPRGEVRKELNSSSPIPAGGDVRVFVTDFDDNVDWGSGPNGDEELTYQLFVVPISLPAPNVLAGNQQFLDQTTSDVPQFAQITRVDNFRHLTEWICYDRIIAPPSGAHPQFVRDHPDVLERVRKLIAPQPIEANIQAASPTPPQGGGPGQPPKEEGFPVPGSTGVGIFRAVSPNTMASTSASANPAALPPLSPAAAPQSTSQDTASALDDFGYWKGDLGVAEDQDYFLTSAVRKTLNFRGVMGTYPHDHPPGTPILPVFRVWRDEDDVGIPGAGDRAWLIFENEDSIGEPVSIHRSYLPGDRYPTQGWLSASYVAKAGTTSTELFEEARSGLSSPDFESQVFIALEERIGTFLPPTEGPTTSSGAPLDREMRSITRLVKFPSGELPRAVDSIAVGGPAAGTNGGPMPDAIVDELEFGATLFGGSMAPGDVARGAAMVLDEALGLGTGSIEIWSKTMRDSRGFFNTGFAPPRELPRGGGLLRIGEELIAYDNVDPGGTAIDIAPGGRGMLGTEEQPHRVGESIYFLSHMRTTTTLGQVGPADADVALADLHGLPESGTLLVGKELLHYTHSDANRGAGVVGMPRASEEPGERDGEGGALFRGRFGTAASAHVTGTPAVLFPTRYLDRWADGAEAPELSYFGFAASQPNAYWQSAFFEESEPQHPGAQLGLLVRASPEIPWDADPDKTDGLWLFDKGQEENRSLALGVQSDLLEWRVFVRYEPGAFDFLSGFAHGWKTTPELRFVGAEFVAPRVTLFREDR